MPPINKAELLRSMEVSYEKGAVIFSEGDLSRDMYILLSGEVEVRKNNRVIATIEGRDTYLGEMSTLLGVPRTATLVASKKCKMICVSEDKVSDFFAHSPVLGIKLARMLAGRLQDMNTRYERVLVDIAPDEDRAYEELENLTQNSSHREFLRLYRRSVDKKMSIKEVVEATEIPNSELNKIFLNFGMSGMIAILGRTVSFMEARNPALRHLIMNWSG